MTRRDAVWSLDALLGPAVYASRAEVPAEIWDRVLVGLARELVARPGKYFRARLVELSCALAGGDAARLSPVLPQLVELVHAGALIVDDVQDGARCRRGGAALHQLCGVPLAINTGNWLYFAAFSLIERAELPSFMALEVHRRLTQTMLQSHHGQALDLAIDVTQLRQPEVVVLAEAIAELKTGALMSFAAELGTLCAQAPAPARRALARFGLALGSALQHLDDLGAIQDVRRQDKGREDLAGHRLNWAWAHLARTLDAATFAALQRRLGDARGDELDALARDLSARLGELARCDVRAELADARRELAEVFGEHPVLVEIGDEIARLERTHG